AHDPPPDAIRDLLRVDDDRLIGIEHDGAAHLDRRVLQRMLPKRRRAGDVLHAAIAMAGDEVLAGAGRVAGEQVDHAAQRPEALGAGHDLQAAVSVPDGGALAGFDGFVVQHDCSHFLICHRWGYFYTSSLRTIRTP